MEEMVQNATGVEEGGSVAENQDQGVVGAEAQTTTQTAPEQAQGQPQTEAQLPGGEDAAKAFASRLAQEREKINQQLQQTFGVGLNDLRTLSQQGQTTNQPRPLSTVGAPGYQYTQPQQPDPRQVNELLAEQLYENPAGVLAAVAQAAAQTTYQQMAPYIHQSIEADLASRYQDYQQVKPVVDEIIQMRPDLVGNAQGLEWAYWTAKGYLADHLVQQAVTQTQQGNAAIEAQKPQAVPQSSQPAAQGGGGGTNVSLAEWIASQT